MHQQQQKKLHLMTVNDTISMLTNQIDTLFRSLITTITFHIVLQIKIYCTLFFTDNTHTTSVYQSVIQTADT